MARGCCSLRSPKRALRCTSSVCATCRARSTTPPSTRTRRSCSTPTRPFPSMRLTCGVAPCGRRHAAMQRALCDDVKYNRSTQHATYTVQHATCNVPGGVQHRTFQPTDTAVLFHMRNARRFHCAPPLRTRTRCRLRPRQGCRQTQRSNGRTHARSCSPIAGGHTHRAQGLSVCDPRARDAGVVPQVRRAGASPARLAVLCLSSVPLGYCGAPSPVLPYVLLVRLASPRVAPSAAGRVPTSERSLPSGSSRVRFAYFRFPFAAISAVSVTEDERAAAGGRPNGLRLRPGKGLGREMWRWAAVPPLGAH